VIGWELATGDEVITGIGTEKSLQFVDSFFTVFAALQPEQVRHDSQC
jgi:hypothetical protein